MAEAGMSHDLYRDWCRELIVREHEGEDGTRGTAVFSPNEQNRYLLMRKRRGCILPTCAPLFVMLNPSTATEAALDPTLRRCQRFAMRLGRCCFMVTNLFSWRATDPKDLKTITDVDGGITNDKAILAAAECAEVIILGWGAHGSLLGRDLAVMRLLVPHWHKLHSFGYTKNGQPLHPLYLRSDAPLIRFRCEVKRG